MFITAPTPVVTPQPMSAALSSGMSGRIFTSVVLVHEQLLGEARQVDELEHRLVAAPQPRRAGRVGGQPDLVAQVRTAGEAVPARAAEAADARDHVIAGLQVRDLRADRFDDAGRLVAEHRGYRARVLALHEVEVGVAQAGGDRLHQHFVRADGADLHVVDDQLAGNVFEHSSFHHGDTNEPGPIALPVPEPVLDIRMNRS